MKCEICEKLISGRDEMHSDDSGEYHNACIDQWNKEQALAAGIPLSVIEGKTKLSDHFSEDYINFKCNRASSLKDGK